MSFENRVMVFYPPSRLYQRGEDRSQGNVEDATATTIRACNDLGYAASMLKTEKIEVFLKDYQTEKLSMDDLLSDFVNFKPNCIFLSITNATIFNDLNIIKKLKDIDNDVVVILKGAIFFDAPDELLNQLDLSQIDYLIGGESDFVVADVVKCHFFNPSKLNEIRGILYKKDGKWVKTNFQNWEEDLDSLVFPDRSLMKNELYVRPDTGEAQATISTSRGCPNNCIYCLTPAISGKKIRLRSPKNIFEELSECYHKYNIRNFFFKSDTFTVNKKWVKELCTYILNSDLNGKIEWVANSRVRPLEKETLEIMKKAGCWLVAFGFESGSPETLEKIKKGASLEDNLRVAKYAKEVGLKVFGFYLIGLPWEKRSNLDETKNMIFKINADFIEIHIATPYHGTDLYNIASKEGLVDETVLGKDYFNSPTIGTKYLSIKELEDYKKKIILSYHLRFGYICKKVFESISKPKVLLHYFQFGLKLLKQNMK